LIVIEIYAYDELELDPANPASTPAVYTSYFDPDWVPVEHEYGEEGNVVSAGESTYYAEDSLNPAGKGKGKAKKSGKQVRFTGAEIGNQSRRSGWDQTSAEGFQELEGAFYNSQPTETPEWTKAFPRLTAPPMPSTVRPAFQKGDMSSLLMSWYMCGKRI